MVGSSKKLHVVVVAALCAVFQMSRAGLGNSGLDVEITVDDGSSDVYVAPHVDFWGTEKDLAVYLFDTKGYCKYVRPVKESNDVVKVEVELSPLEITDVDDRSHRLTMTTFLRVRWNDGYLKWDPVMFGGLDHFTLADNLIWKPILGISDKATPDAAFFPSVKTAVVIENDGSVFRALPFTFTVRCPGLTRGAMLVDCTFSILSWLYDDEQVQLALLGPINTADFEDTHPDWRFVSMSGQIGANVYPAYTGSRTYSTVDYKVTLQRRPGTPPRIPGYSRNQS